MIEVPARPRKCSVTRCIQVCPFGPRRSESQACVASGNLASSAREAFSCASRRLACLDGSSLAPALPGEAFSTLPGLLGDAFAFAAAPFAMAASVPGDAFALGACLASSAGNEPKWLRIIFLVILVLFLSISKYDDIFLNISKILSMYQYCSAME